MTEMSLTQPVTECSGQNRQIQIEVCTETIAQLSLYKNFMYEPGFQLSDILYRSGVF